jgi:hypothetical protein
VSVYSDNEQDVQALYEIFESGTNPKNDKTVFGQIIPEPDWSKIPLTANTVKEYDWDRQRGDVGELPVMLVDEDKPFRNGLRFKSTDTMDDRWYNWRVQNWGTKWDCYDLTIDESELPNGFEATFNTAWSPPEDICNALKEKYEGMSISWFYDEPGMEVAGYL